MVFWLILHLPNLEAPNCGQWSHSTVSNRSNTIKSNEHTKVAVVDHLCKSTCLRLFTTSFFPGKNRCGIFEGEVSFWNTQLARHGHSCCAHRSWTVLTRSGNSVFTNLPKMENCRAGKRISRFTSDFEDFRSFNVTFFFANCLLMWCPWSLHSKEPRPSGNQKPRRATIFTLGCVPWSSVEFEGNLESRDFMAMKIQSFWERNFVLGALIRAPYAETFTATSEETWQCFGVRSAVDFQAIYLCNKLRILACTGMIWRIYCCIS